MRIFCRGVALVCMAALSGVSLAHAQATTGSIAGNVTDASGAMLPGVNVSLSGDRLIGGAQWQSARRDPGLPGTGSARVPAPVLIQRIHATSE